MKNKFVLSLIIVLSLFLITGCGVQKKNTENTEVSREEKLKKDLKDKCDKAEIAAYNLYKQNHTNEIIDGVCGRYDFSENIVYFTAGENLVYKYKYNVSEDKITSPDNDNYHTEKMDEYAAKCEGIDVAGSTQATCANHKYMLSEYQEYVAGVTERPNVFRKVDLSRLK